MKLSLLIFVVAAVFTELAFGLAQSGESSYSVLPGRRCEAQNPACCRHASKCTLRYSARGLWTTEQDRTATEDACKAVCEVHYGKCKDLCDCVARQTEVRSTAICKCKLTPPRIFVRNNCLRRCIDARNKCISDCHTKKCPLKAVTRMSWSQEFEGSCDAICQREHPLSTVCHLASAQ